MSEQQRSLSCGGDNADRGIGVHRSEEGPSTITLFPVDIGRPRRPWPTGGRRSRHRGARGGLPEPCGFPSRRLRLRPGGVPHQPREPPRRPRPRGRGAERFAAILEKYDDNERATGILELSRARWHHEAGELAEAIADGWTAARHLASRPDMLRRGEARTLPRSMRQDNPEAVDQAWDIAAVQADQPTWLCHLEDDAGLVDQIVAWVQAPTWEASQDFLANHAPDLLTGPAEAAIEHLIDANPRPRGTSPSSGHPPSGAFGGHRGHLRATPSKGGSGSAPGLTLKREDGQRGTCSPHTRDLVINEDTWSRVPMRAMAAGDSFLTDHPPWAACRRDHGWSPAKAPDRVLVTPTVEKPRGSGLEVSAREQARLGGMGTGQTRTFCPRRQ